MSGFEIFLKMPDISVGTTPHEIIYTEDKMKLLHYIPTVEKTHPVPIFMVYALVNRYYILDLQPDKSVIKNFWMKVLMCMSLIGDILQVWIGISHLMIM